MFASKDKMIKKAETREEREHERSINRVHRETEKKNDELEIDLKPRLKPERKDMKKPKLFEGSNDAGYDDIPITDTEKTAEIKENVALAEKEKEKWEEKLVKMGLDNNSKRIILAMEDNLIKANGNSQERIKLLKEKYLPQLFTSKIQGKKTFQEKTKLVKERYGEKIQDLSVFVDFRISKANENEKPIIIRNCLEQILKEK